MLISYTNHALDHLLEDVLQSNITTNIARLGSQSTNELVNTYTLEKLEKDADDKFPNWGRALKRSYAEMKELEDEIEKVMRFMQCRRPAWKVIHRYLEKHYGRQANELASPPPWIKKLVEYLASDEAQNGEWRTKSSKRKELEIKQYKGTIYGAWREGADLDVLGQTDNARLLNSLACPTALRKVPASDRPLEVLKNAHNVWSLSLTERQRLAMFWEDSVRTSVFDDNLSRYNSLRSRYKMACEHFNDVRDEVSLTVIVVSLI